MFKNYLVRAVASALLLPGLLPAQVPSPDAKPGLRERIQERMQERRAARLDAAGVQPALTQPGTHYLSLHHEGLERAYTVHLPTSYRSGTSMPVLFAFHGGGGDMKLQAGEQYGLVAKAESAGFIAVFPNGHSRFPGGKFATWNAGTCCGTARDEKSDDVGFVRAILAQLQARVSVDNARIFATGMSNGGMFSYRLACEMADVFKAIAPVAGTDNTLHCNPAAAVSVLHFHAKDDTHVLYGGGAGADAMRDRSKVSDFVSVPQSILNWTRRNQCSGGPKRVLAVEGAYCNSYENCADGAKVQVCVTETGGHSWPGGGSPRAGKVQASTAISANDVMWKFFQTR
jgi:polyhydroxybutyrate depolymerase